MSPEEVITFSREAIYVMLRLSLPLLVVGLIVGLVVSIIQSLTQIQEMTLTFIPKIISVFLVLLLLLPWMGGLMAGFVQAIADQIINIAVFWPSAAPAHA